MTIEATAICIINGPLEPMGGNEAKLNVMRHGLALRILGDIVHIVEKGRGRGRKRIQIWEARITLVFWNIHKVALEAAGFWIQWPQKGEEGKGKDGLSKHLAKIKNNLG